MYGVQISIHLPQELFVNNNLECVPLTCLECALIQQLYKLYIP